MSKVRILTPAFESGDQKLQASFRGMDKSRLKEKTFRLGLLDNTKPGTGLLLEKIGEELTEGGFVRNTVSLAKSVTVVLRGQGSNPASTPVSQELLDRLVEETDFVITGLGN